MQVVCVKCSRALEYSGPCPSFCAYCGQALSDATVQTASVSDPDAVTQAPAVPARAHAAPAAVGGFRLGRELGVGGMGAVYEAEEIATGRRVALKLIKPEYAGSADAVERFRQEGRIASMIVHPRCVFVLAVDEEAGQPYIVMELMPGATLKDVVSERGALPPDEAVAKVLDVIDGLQAAHRLEVIHRDVKPSNCFIEVDGRVKVGDFGLAKSLVQEGHLTKTGAFVGTPHFASPEQIRTEAIDGRTDVYSVAATLYYLLTGKPPFFGADTAATLARIVTDPPPSLRSLRPELSPALDAVVLRGLERDRDRRYSDLESFRQALVGLTPAPLTLGSALFWRAAAYGVDACLFAATIGCAVQTTAFAALAGARLGDTDLAVTGATIVAAQMSASLILFALYFLLAERFGASLGKRFFGLRVCTGRTIDPPSWAAVSRRSVLFVGIAHAPAVPAFFFLRHHVPPVLLFLGCPAIGLVVLVSTMRARNGYRGLHEVLSGTRVVQPVRPRETMAASGGWLLSFLHGRRQAPVQTGPLPQRIAGFAIRGALKWTAADKVLLGEDASLGRRVFLWLRPGSAPPLDAARRGVGRRTRLRWLGCGKQGDFQWDAILAPQGAPLPEYFRTAGPLTWRDARLLLVELASELAAAVADRTVPATLSVEHVWVTEDGRLQLADLALTTAGADESSIGGDAEQRALTLLRRVTMLALPSAAALPADARRWWERVAGNGPQFEAMPQVCRELENTAVA